jgi:hypothetical protein
MPGVQFYSLQKEPRAEDGAAVLAALRDDVVDLAPALGDFAGGSRCGARSRHRRRHVGGASCRRARPSSVEAMQLFRQRAPREWDDPLMRLTAALAVLAAKAEG